jgi:DNA-binding LacI/PurR family transcriptional regulator
VAASADITLAALSCPRELGVAVPEEVALVGTGQLDWAPLASPPLSVLENDGASLERHAVRCALGRVAGHSGERAATPQQRLVPPVRLVVRATSKSDRPSPG